MIRSALGFLCCAMTLFAAAAQAQPHGKHTYQEAEGVLDHFLCYRLDPGSVSPAGVGLRDQFTDELEPVTAMSRGFLCNPVDKDGVKRQRPESHLLCYHWFEDLKKPPQVRVANQIHPNQLLWLYEADLLCVPSGKEYIKEGESPGPTPPKIPGDLDHFKCYMQHPVFAAPTLRRRHGFTDQFSSYFLFNFRAVFLCNPVEKYRHGKLEVGRLHDFAHLVCYEVTEQLRRVRQVRIANQFEPDATVKADRLQMACFPSTKTVQRRR
jgi:hypothetical protein